MGLSEINAGTVQDYRVHRIGSATAGKAPARSTLHDEVGTLRQVLKTAIRHKWLNHLPDLSPPYKTQGKITHRPWFSPVEYKQLYEATRQNAKEPKNPHFRWEAEQLHDFILFMGNTGLRPDEAKQLQHRDVTIIEDPDSRERILEIEVRGKRGIGWCKSMPGAVKPYERLRDRLKPVRGKDKEGARLSSRLPSRPTSCSPAIISRCSITFLKRRTLSWTGMASPEQPIAYVILIFAFGLWKVLMFMRLPRIVAPASK
ncbi:MULTISPECIES: hypothetical protein [unclassified Rhizobium]|uniref:hypothetical protein n=1 Tax=unclassified Rhizobium TaxID=2613769 RepID=UPI001FD898E9|nr:MULTISPECIES: hypothetical protein [unclassified Rhizobium]